MFCSPLWWRCVQGACAVPCFCSRHPVFAPGSSKVAVAWVLGGFFGLFVSFGSRICPNCACTQLFLVPYSFFVFCSLRRGVSRCNVCSIVAKGLRSQQKVSGPSLSQKQSNNLKKQAANRKKKKKTVGENSKRDRPSPGARRFRIESFKYS